MERQQNVYRIVVDSHYKKKVDIMKRILDFGKEEECSIHFVLRRTKLNKSERNGTV